jgi:riboflavin synthase
LRLVIGVGALPFGAVVLGESIAVSGVCLTVVEFDATSFATDVSTETLACTTVGGWEPGDVVNLERAMRPDSRFGGHIVAGHVDGTGQIASINEDARSQRWRITPPTALLRYVAAKGSICVDGVSLTVNVADDSGFEVNLIPHTVAHTTFNRRRAGDAVNLEVDLMARYAERLLQFREEGRVGVG